MMPMNHKKITILNTRAAHQAKSLSERMRKAGGNAVELACMDIAAMDDPLYLQQQLKQLANYDYIIFVSANAVYHAMPHCLAGVKPVIIAQGPGTAAALAEFAIKPDWMPDQHNSQGVLDLAVMQSVRHKRVMILCGEDPRPCLMQGLQARGAVVARVFCYQRKKPALTRDDFTSLDREAIDVVVTSSLHVLRNLHTFVVDFTQTWLYDKPLLVVSKEMLVYANRIPWRGCIMQSEPSVEAIVNRLSID